MLSQILRQGEYVGSHVHKRNQGKLLTKKIRNTEFIPFVTFYLRS